MGSETIGERIRRAYLEAGLNRNQFAKAVGTYYHNVIRWENGETTPNLDSLILIAQVTGWSEARLIHGEDVPDAVDPPPSFVAWRSVMGPAILPPDVENRMLRTGFQFPVQQSHRWDQVYDLVMAESRSRADHPASGEHPRTTTGNNEPPRRTSSPPANAPPSSQKRR